MIKRSKFIVEASALEQTTITGELTTKTVFVTIDFEETEKNLMCDDVIGSNYDTCSVTERRWSPADKDLCVFNIEV